MYERRDKHKPGPKVDRGQNGPEPGGRTREALAEELGVGARTLDRDRAFTKAVEILPEVKEKIQKGERVVKKDVIAAANTIRQAITHVIGRRKKHCGNTMSPYCLCTPSATPKLP